MDFWTAIVIICALPFVFGIPAEMYKYRQKTKQKLAEADLDRSELSRRLEQIEDRLANLETLVLDDEKHRRFDAVIHGG